MSEIETTYIESFNGTLCQWCKRLTRKKYAFSKKWEMLEAALALEFAHYNFCRKHRALKKTPATAEGLTDNAWSVRSVSLHGAEISIRGCPRAHSPRSSIDL